MESIRSPREVFEERIGIFQHCEVDLGNGIPHELTKMLRDILIHILSVIRIVQLILIRR